MHNYSCLLACSLHQRKFYSIYFIPAAFSILFSFLVLDTARELHHEIQRIFALLMLFLSRHKLRFFARSWPAANLPAFLHFPRCVSFEPAAIYRALAKRVSPKGASKRVKKREKIGRKGRGSEEFGAASKHPSLRASFMVKLRTNDRVSMRCFSGAKKRRKKRKKENKKKRMRGKRDCRSLSRVSRASRENEFGRNEGEEMRKVEGERNGKRHAGALSSRRVES